MDTNAIEIHHWIDFFFQTYFFHENNIIVFEIFCATQCLQRGLLSSCLRNTFTEIKYQILLQLQIFFFI